MTEPVHTYMHLYIYTCLRNNCATTFPPTRHRRPEFFNAQLFPAPIRGKRSRREFRNYPRDRAPGPVQMHVFLALHYAFVIQNVRRGRETHSRDTRARMERRHGCWMQKKRRRRRRKLFFLLAEEKFDSIARSFFSFSPNKIIIRTVEIILITIIFLQLENQSAVNVDDSNSRLPKLSIKMLVGWKGGRYLIPNRTCI